MEREPLLPYVSSATRRPPTPPSLPPPPPPISLPPLLEDGVSIPPRITPSGLKEYLIFGPASPSSPSAPLLLGSPVRESPAMRHISNSGMWLNNFFTDSNIASSSSSSSSSSINLDPKRASFDHHQPPWIVDPNNPLTKHNLHRCKTAPAMAVINARGSPMEEEEPQFGSQSTVRQSIMLLILYLSLGVVIYSCFREHFHANETHPVVDALYFCIVTMCTIGYGDITPATTATKLFSMFFVLIGFGSIDILLSGMVTYVLDLQENYLLKTIKGGGAHDPGRYIIDVKKGRMRIRMKVGLALGVVVLCIGVGGFVMHYVERLNWLDSFYLSVMSVTTVGYGDRAFTSLTGRIFASIWLLVSTLAVARAFLYLTEARVDKRHRRVAKWVLSQNMTADQFYAADIDHNGFVSKSEFVIYKLKQMGKVTEKDIMLICKQFERLDTGNNGKITLSALETPFQ